MLYRSRTYLYQVTQRKHKSSKYSVGRGKEAPRLQTFLCLIIPLENLCKTHWNSSFIIQLQKLRMSAWLSEVILFNKALQHCCLRGELLAHLAEEGAQGGGRRRHNRVFFFFFFFRLVNNSISSFPFTPLNPPICPSPLSFQIHGLSFTRCYCIHICI